MRNYGNQHFNDWNGLFGEGTAENKVKDKEATAVLYVAKKLFGATDPRIKDWERQAKQDQYSKWKDPLTFGDLEKEYNTYRFYFVPVIDSLHFSMSQALNTDLLKRPAIRWIFRHSQPNIDFYIVYFKEMSYHGGLVVNLSPERYSVLPSLYLPSITMEGGADFNRYFSVCSLYALVRTLKQIT